MRVLLPEAQKSYGGPGAPAARGMMTVAVFAAIAVVLWFGLGMDRGAILSNDIKAFLWPWAPTYLEKPASGFAVYDPVFQFVPWLQFARGELLAGRLPLWNPHQDGGVPLLGNMISALMSPLSWPALLLGIFPGWNLSLLARVLFALVAAYAWLRDLGRSRPAASLGAVGFALSGSFIAWLGHPHTATVAPVPLVFLFARRVALGGSRRDRIGLAVSTSLVLAGGHPETQMMAAVLAFGVVLVETRRPARLAAAAGTALVGAGLAAPVVFPFLEYFRLCEARLGVDRTLVTLAPRDLLRFLSYQVAGSNPIEGAASISAAVLVLVPFGLSAVRRDRWSFFWAVAAACFLAIVYGSPVSRWLAGHTMTNWTRLLLFMPLALGYLAAAGTDALREKFGGSSPMFTRVVPLLLVGAAALELTAGARGLQARTRVRPLSPITPLIASLQADQDVFRVLPLHSFLAANAATDYGLDDVRGYDALAPAGWRRQRAAIGRFTSARDILEPWNLTPGGGALDFWNVKYLILHPDMAHGADTLREKLGLDLELVYEGPDGSILRNRRVLPRARIVGAPGSVRIDQRLPMRWKLLATLSGPGALLVANPTFPGWKVKVDGRTAPITVAPGSPIELPLPAGRHVVELLYRPASFWLGIAVAAVSLAALIALSRKRSAA